DPRHAHAALQLARRLRDDAEPGQPTQASVTSPTPPEAIGDDLVAVPHLITLHTREGDTVFWVLLPTGEAIPSVVVPTPGISERRDGSYPRDRVTDRSRHPGAARRAAGAGGPPPDWSTSPAAD